MTKAKSGASSSSVDPGRHVWIDGCPCLGCPYDENGECIDLKYSALCTYMEKWVLGLHSPGTNRNAKMHIAIKKPKLFGARTRRLPLPDGFHHL